MMKKKILLALALVFLIAGLGACGNENKANEEGKKETKKDVIRVGMELKWPPFEMADENGTPDGISVLIAEEFGKYIGKEVEIVDLPFSTLVTALESEKIDIVIGSMGITEERAQKIHFSEPYMYFKLLSAINKNSGIKSIDELFSKEGVRFVSPKSFTAIDVIKEKANKPNILEFDDKATATLELASGNADAFVVDAVSAVGISKNYPDVIDVLYDAVYVSPVAMGIKKGDSELQEKANEFISKMEELGVNDKIREQYNDTLNDLVGKDFDFYLNEN